MSTCTWIELLSVIVIALGAIQLRTISATGNESTPGNEDGDEEEEEYPTIKKDLILAFTEKAPYTPLTANGSLEGDSLGLFKDVLFRYIIIDCGIDMDVTYDIESLTVDSEFHSIELLRQNKVHAAGPIFKSKTQRYDEFSFFKLTDYPGSEFITNEDEANKLSLVFNAVLKSWSLFAVTLILTAIAGVIMWALVWLILCM